MDTPQPTIGMPGSTLTRASLAKCYRGFGRRRRFMLPGFHQGRAIVWVSLLTIICLYALDFAIFELQRSRSEQILQVAPELSRLILAQDHRMMMIIYLGSFAALVVVACITLFESHRTAGPLYNLARTLERLGTEGPSVRVRFRKDDKFRRLETTFNGAAAALQAKSLAQAKEAGRIAGGLKEAASRLAKQPADASSISVTLLQLAASAERLEESLKHP